MCYAYRITLHTFGSMRVIGDYLTPARAHRVLTALRIANPTYVYSVRRVMVQG